MKKIVIFAESSQGESEKVNHERIFLDLQFENIDEAKAKIIEGLKDGTLSYRNRYCIGEFIACLVGKMSVEVNDIMEENSESPINGW